MATKKKATARGSKELPLPWNDAGRFLKEGWPSFVETHSDGAAKAEALEGAVKESFQLWGESLPKDLALLFAPLASRPAPALAELTLGSHAPWLAKTGNLAEQRIVAAQQYRPLWKELVAGVVEIGSTSSGDIWMYGREPQRGKARAQIYLYSHESDTLETPQAKDLDALLFRAALVQAQRQGKVDAATFTAAGESLQGNVGDLSYEDVFPKLKSYKAETEPAYDNDLRGGWLATLLTEVDASDAELRGAFSLDSNEPLTEELLASSVERFKHFPPAAFYFCLASFFAGDDARLTQALELSRLSEAPLVKDLVTLMEELRAGRKQLGVIRDVHALRARVMALELWDPEAPARAFQKAVAEAAEPVARAAKEGTLDALAWASVKDRAVLAAVEKAYAEDATMAPTLGLLSTWSDEEGYRDEEVIAELLEKGDRRIVPLLVSRALQEDRESNIAMDVLAEWAEPRSVESLRDTAKGVDRFHIKRHMFIRLVQSVGDRGNAKDLVAILKANPPREEDGEGEKMLAALAVALGELGDPSAADALLRYLDTQLEDVGTEAPIHFGDAVLYALGALGEARALAPLMARVEANKWAPSESPGLCFALGRLAAGADAGTRRKVAAMLEAVRITQFKLEGSDGKVRPRTRASLFNEVGGQTMTTACQVMLEDALVGLTEGAAREEALAHLKDLVPAVLTGWEARQDDQWSGYDGYALLAWTLMALRRHPDLGRGLASPFVDFSVPLVRHLAKQVVRG
ncbi:hypothetical protein SAMN05443572_10723 [Myxococcus fulvus]|uniref:HEAT repeat domain-containing protein n=1 Tax=Myxococcus fulvus TaxID=33 RepID=A0A511T7D7_MYXFU|nr:hypothetical protein MFU01_51110 [Myxococcus fulvus]SEU24963.1 hypothetical protein SAMN05443572_10723 [Myxococcus fulvus]